MRLVQAFTLKRTLVFPLPRLIDLCSQSVTAALALTTASVIHYGWIHGNAKSQSFRAEATTIDEIERVSLPAYKTTPRITPNEFPEVINIASSLMQISVNHLMGLENLPTLFHEIKNLSISTPPSQLPQNPFTQPFSELDYGETSEIWVARAAYKRSMGGENTSSSHNATAAKDENYEPLSIASTHQSLAFSPSEAFPLSLLPLHQSLPKDFKEIDLLPSSISFSKPSELSFISPLVDHRDNQEEAYANDDSFGKGLAIMKEWTYSRNYRLQYYSQMLDAFLRRPETRGFAAGIVRLVPAFDNKIRCWEWEEDLAQQQAFLKRYLLETINWKLTDFTNGLTPVENPCKEDDAPEFLRIERDPSTHKINKIAFSEATDFVYNFGFIQKEAEDYNESLR